MLRITGKNIGDTVEITLVCANGEWSAQEKVNGRTVYPLVLDPGKVRIGDRCLVRLTDEDVDRTLYEAMIEKVIRHGDGRQTDLQQLLMELRACSSGYESVLQPLIVHNRCVRFKADPRRNIEGILDVLEYYMLEDAQGLPPLDYDLFASALINLVALLPECTREERLEYCLRAARYSSHSVSGLRAASDLVGIAHNYSLDDARLERKVAAESERQTEAGIRIMERTLVEKAREGTHWLLRLRLAGLMLKTRRQDLAQVAIGVIEPVYNELRGTDYFNEVARILAEAFEILGAQDNRRYWEKRSRRPALETIPATGTEWILEASWRMTPRMKRRVSSWGREASSGS